jgi:hypothetical protein
MTRVVPLLAVFLPLLTLGCNRPGGESASTRGRSDTQRNQRAWNDRARKEFNYVTRELEKHAGTSRGNR